MQKSRLSSGLMSALVMGLMSGMSLGLTSRPLVPFDPFAKQKPHRGKRKVAVRYEASEEVKEHNRKVEAAKEAAQAAKTARFWDRVHTGGSKPFKGRNKSKYRRLGLI